MDSVFFCTVPSLSPDYFLSFLFLYIGYSIADDSTPSNLPFLASQPDWNSEQDVDVYEYTKAYLVKKFMPEAKNLLILRDPTAKYVNCSISVCI